MPTHHIEAGYPLGTWIINQRQFRKRGRLSAERIARLEALPGWSWDRVDDEWESNFAVLRRYAAREGDASVPAEHIEAGLKLGRWVVKRRSEYRRGKLAPERVARLEALPGWVWHSKEAHWEEGYAALGRFIAREGYNRVPRSHVEDGFALGNWLTWQRQLFRHGELLRTRRERLESLPGWTWASFGADWEEGFSRLESFVEREGHARVPTDHSEDLRHLGAWVGTQRQQRRRGRLATERVARLEALPGWVWHSKEADWEEGYAALGRFVGREGHAGVPGDHCQGRFRLGQWVAVQRSAHKRGKLLAERRARLEALPGWVWNRRDADWSDAFSRLERFVEREGHARVTTGASGHIEEGFRLGLWVTTQRHAHRRGKLSATRTARLEALPGWTWDARKRP